MSLTIATWVLAVVTLGLLIANGFFVFITWWGVKESKRPFFILSPTKEDLNIFICVKNIGNGPAKDLKWHIESDSKKSTVWDKGCREYVGIMEECFLKTLRQDDYENNEIWKKEKLILEYKDIFNRKFLQTIKLNFHETPTLDFVRKNWKWFYGDNGIKLKERIKEVVEAYETFNKGK
jgi:hypothetical protein